ncbi:MAG: PQQ-dependent sugar dehydrogenase, partial [Acidobacteriota bacterium]|nr:PQQ-dependent sugar dehydrogenase [Acidobacteriota bacterium]
VLYVAAHGAGQIVAIPKQGQTVAALRGLNGPHSLTFRGSDLYVSVNDGVIRFPEATPVDFVIRSSGQRILTVPSGGQHSSRTMDFGPDDRIYATAGSTCNFCVEADSRRAAMMRYDADGSNETLFAAGLRNTVSFAWHPVTGELWSVDNGGDGLGDDEPPEEIDILRAGGDYGWPDCVGQRRGVNWGTGARPSRCPATIGPELEMQAHSAPLGIAFYTGDRFPASYLNDALIGFHGSWNRNVPTGYKVARVRASSGRAAGMEDFLWGFFDPATRTASGRPVQAITGPDGAVYVSDDASGNIYRVSYEGPRITPSGIVNRGAGIFELYGQRLGGASLYINGMAADILYGGENQINFVLPDAFINGSSDGLGGEVSIAAVNEKARDEAVFRLP